MKCNNCGSEWSVSTKYSQISSCPFCGSSLIRTENSSKETTISETMKLIFQQFGINIILQKNKFLSIFVDYAPRLKKEKKILSVALDENIADFFVNCEVEEREANIQKARRAMNLIMSESAIDLVISSFTDALGWVDICGLDSNCAEADDVFLSEEKNDAANFKFDSAEDFFHIVQDNILEVQNNGIIFDRERYEKERRDSRCVHACQMLNNGNYSEAHKCFEGLLHPDSTNPNKIGSALAGLKLAQMYFWGEGIDIDKREAARIMVSLINTGNPLVIAWISDYYRVAVPGVTIKDNVFSKVIFDVCSKELEIMADLGDPDAQYFFGCSLIYGWNCDKNTNKGFKYIKDSADSGNVHSLLLLSNCYFNGIGTEANKKKGVNILLDLEECKCPAVQFKLGLLYYLDKYQDFVLKDYSKALKYILHAATSGHVSAMACAGDLFYYGEGTIKQNYSAAKDWYELSAKSGDVHSSAQLGTIYYYGEGANENEDLAFDYFKFAADNGNVYSQYMLHFFYFSDGKYKNFEIGIQYLEKAAEQGHADSQFLLAVQYHDDDYKLVYWLKKAAEQGHADAEQFLGEAYIELNNEKVLMTDYAKGIKWLEKAAEHGNADAMVYLSEFYSNGTYVLVDTEKAIKMASSVIDLIDNKSIEKDEIEKFTERISVVMFNIGKHYWNSKQKELSFRYFESSWLMSVENSEAAKMMAHCYKYGIGVKKDRKKAKLYSKLS